MADTGFLQGFSNWLQNAPTDQKAAEICRNLFPHGIVIKQGTPEYEAVMKRAREYDKQGYSLQDAADWLQSGSPTPPPESAGGMLQGMYNLMAGNGASPMTYEDYLKGLGPAGTNQAGQVAGPAQTYNPNDPHQQLNQYWDEEINNSAHNQLDSFYDEFGQPLPRNATPANTSMAPAAPDQIPEDFLRLQGQIPGPADTSMAPAAGKMTNAEMAAYLNVPESELSKFFGSDSKTDEELAATLRDKGIAVPERTPAKEGMTQSQKMALNEQYHQALVNSMWNDSLQRGLSQFTPWTYNGPFIPTGGGGGGSAGGSNQITGLPGYGNDELGGSGGDSATGGTTSAPGSEAPTGPTAPTINPAPLPQAPTYGNTPQTGGGTAGTTGTTAGGGGSTVPDWLAPFMQPGGGGSVLPPDLLQTLGLNPQTGLPQYPTSPGTTTSTSTGSGTGTAPTDGGGGVQVPGATLPNAPDLPNPTLNFPDIPGYQSNLPNYDPNSLSDLWGSITGNGGTAGGSLYPGQNGASGGTGTGGSPDLLNQLMGNYQGQQDAANQANETRYQDILQGYGDRSNTALEMLGNLGLTERNQIKEAYEKSRGATEQSLTSRGLSNTTVMPSVLRGVDNDYTRSMGELQQRINSTGLGVYTGTTGDMLGFMERRTDAGPDSSFLASLAGGLGEAGYGAAPPSGVNSTPASGGGGASTPSSSNSSTPQTAQSFSLSQSDFNSLGLGGGSSQQPQQSSQASTPQGALSDWMSNMNSGYQQNIQQPQQGGYNQDGSFTNLAGNTFMMNSPENNPYGSMPRTGGPGPVPVPDWLKQQYQSTLGY